MFFQKKSSRFFAMLVISTLLSLPLSSCGDSPAKTAAQSFFAMDTLVTVTLPVSDDNAAKDTLLMLSDTLDCYHTGSQVAQLNETGFLQDAPETAQLVRQVLALEARFGDAVQLSCGALTMLWGITTENPSVPDKVALQTALQTISDSAIQVEDDSISLPTDTSLDLGAVAKGYALDVVASQWDAAGYTYGVLSMQSSVLLYGEKPDGKAFTVQIQRPDGGGILGTVTTGACFLATSGGYERFFEADGETYCHLLDMRTGYPTRSDLTTVTVFTNNGLKADYLSTLIFLEGTAHLKQHLAAEDYKVLAADTNGTLYISEGLSFAAAQS